MEIIKCDKCKKVKKPKKGKLFSENKWVSGNIRGGNPYFWTSFDPVRSLGQKKFGKFFLRQDNLTKRIKNILADYILILFGHRLLTGLTFAKNVQKS